MFCACGRSSSNADIGKGGHIFLPQAIYEHGITAFDESITVAAFDE
jgi:hypothetical protein